MSTSNPLEEITKLQEQIESLKNAAVAELTARRATLQQEIKSVDHEIEKITGKPVKVRASRLLSPANGVPGEKVTGKKPDLQQLKALLAAAPEKTISLRKEGYDVRNVKVMAEANPHLLRMGGKGPWPTVTLLR